MADPAETIDPQAAAILGEAAALDAAAAPPPLDPATGQPAAPLNFTDEARTLVDLAAGTLQAIYPFVTIADATRARLAGAWAPVLEKYELTGAGIFGQYAPEIGAAIVTVPIALQIRAAILAHKEPPKADPTPTQDGQPAWMAEIPE